MFYFLSKIEEAFYASRFCINGNKLLKKYKEVKKNYFYNKAEIIS